MTSVNTYYGTPGMKTTVCSIESRMMKEVAHPKMTKVTLYMYTPSIMNKTPMTSIAIVYPMEFLLKYVHKVVLATDGQPILLSALHGYDKTIGFVLLFVVLLFFY